MMDKIRAWFKGMWKSRTILFSRLLALLGIVQVQANLWLPYLGTYGGLVLFGVAVVMEVFRWITVKPVDQKQGLRK